MAVIYDKSMFCSIYKNVAAVMILYDISKHTSFQDAVDDWLEEVKRAGLYHPVILLVGHKNDMRPIRSVTTSEAQDFAGQLDTCISFQVVNALNSGFP